MGARPKQILESVLSRISPSASEVKGEVGFAKSVIRKISKASPKGCRVVLAGSIAKGTFLRDSKDLDVFVLVQKSIPKTKMEELLKSIMKKAYPGLGYQLSYAEHPYLRFHLEGRKVDLVPAYDIKHSRERLSAVDRSVLHTKYIISNLKDNQKSDVLLLKQLLKANSLYGAEIKTEGFPGYLCELLVHRYGSFMGVMRAASGWKLPVTIDCAGHYPKKELALLPARFNTLLVVIDPTDCNRNVAAALSVKNTKAFISLCKRFSKSPSEGIFMKAPKSFQQKLAASRRNFRIITLELPKPNVVDDILWGQLKKLMKQLVALMKEFGPGEPFADDKLQITIALPVKELILPEKEILLGPPEEMKEHIKKFKSAHKDARFMKKSGRLCAIKKRQVRAAEEVLAGFFKKYSKTGTHLSNPQIEIKVLD